MHDTAVLRHFNRSWSQRVGVLSDSFLGLGMPLSLARLLFEIDATRPGPATIQDLRARLGLDSGHASRLITDLEARGLVAVSPDPADRRRRVVALSPAGRRVLVDLEDRSEQIATRLLEPLGSRQRERLDRALAEADLLIRAATVEFVGVLPTAAAARTAMAAYLADLDARFAHGFAHTAADAADDPSLHPPHGTVVVALSDGEPVAAGGVRWFDGYAEIKRMWVHAEWRGAGLGGRMLRHLEGLALDHGHRVVRLDTNESLAEAIAMYERSGYRRIERYNDNPNATHFYAKDL